MLDLPGRLFAAAGRSTRMVVLDLKRAKRARDKRGFDDPPVIGLARSPGHESRRAAPVSPHVGLRTGHDGPSNINSWVWRSTSSNCQGPRNILAAMRCECHVGAITLISCPLCYFFCTREDVWIVALRAKSRHLRKMGHTMPASHCRRRFSTTVAALGVS